MNSKWKCKKLQAMPKQMVTQSMTPSTMGTHTDQYSWRALVNRPPVSTASVRRTAMKVENEKWHERHGRASN